MSSPHADLALATRIESAGVRDMEAYVVAARESAVYSDAAFFRVAGGIATWFSQDNVLNGAAGLGIGGPVELEEVAALEAFYRDRMTPPQLDVCPLADPSLLKWLAMRGFVAASFENVLVRGTGDIEDPPLVFPGVDVLVGEAADREQWAELEARGFTEDEPSPQDRRVALASSMRDDVTRFIATVDGRPGGAGLFSAFDGVGHLNGDSTLPACRGRGAQQAVIAARLHHAAELGCDLVYVETTPGSASQRNMERAGFRIAYTRVTMVAPADG